MSVLSQVPPSINNSCEGSSLPNDGLTREDCRVTPPPVRTRRRPVNTVPSAEPDRAGQTAAVDAKDPALAWTRDLSLTITYRPMGELSPSPRNARTHSEKQVRKLAA